jgi:hypothetical protein
MALQNLPKLRFLVWKYTIWQPWSVVHKQGYNVSYEGNDDAKEWHMKLFFPVAAGKRTSDLLIFVYFRFIALPIAIMAYFHYMGYGYTCMLENDLHPLYVWFRRPL